MLFKLAWRNIWRNKRRTFITIASILFAVLFATFMEAWQKGAWNNKIRNGVNLYFRYVQVHQNGYWDEQSIDKAFVLSDSVLRLEGEVPAIQQMLPRLESFALASTGKTTMGAMVVGIDPRAENDMTNLKERLISGVYLEDGDQAVIVAEGIAENLALRTGDTLILVSQGFRGVNAAGKYPVKGIISFPSPDLNKQLIYLPLPEAQWFYGAEDRVTSLAFKLGDQDDITPAVRAIKTKLGTDAYEVMDWKEMLPDLLQAKALDSAGNVIVYIILYLIIAFGIFGTILMMTKEREYEFGILTAIGMRRMKLAATVWLEVVLLGVAGALAGILVSIPLVYWFKIHPIRFSGEYAGAMEKFGFEPVFPTEFEAGIFFTQAVVVFVLTSILALFPVFKIRRLRPVEAMRP